MTDDGNHAAGFLRGLGEQRAELPPTGAPYGYHETLANPYGFTRAVIAKAHRSPSGNYLLDIATELGPEQGLVTGASTYTYHGATWVRLSRIVIHPEAFASMLADLDQEAGR